MRTYLIVVLSPLLNTHTAVLFAPPIIGLFGDPDLSAGFSDRDTLIDVDLGFPQLVDDLFRSEVLSDHLSPLLSF